MPRPDANAAVFVERFFQFSLLGLVTSGYLAVAGSGHLDAPTVLLTAAGLLLRALLVCGVVRLDIPERATTYATLAYALFFLADYLALSRDFLTATVHLVFFLAVVKILTARNGRDDLYIAVIAFMELLAAAILSANLNFFLFLGLFLLFAIAGLSSGEIRRSMRRSSSTARSGLRRFHPRLALLAASVTLGILFLTAGLFFILPRTAEAAFARFSTQRIVLPGFANQVTLGQVGDFRTSSRPVMHVRIYSQGVLGAFKWRGGVLTEFDGKRWSDPFSQLERIQVEGGTVALRDPGAPGRHINYDVNLEPLDSKALFFAGVPERISVRSSSLLRGRAGTYLLERAPSRNFAYTAYSRLEDPPGTTLHPLPVLPLAEREHNLQQPRLDPRIAELARRFSAGTVSDLERARAIEKALKNQYTYSLRLPRQEPSDPLADFLFVRKTGYCEYFASAMAVMLRTMDIPARLATGFQSGVYNPLTELWLVRASDAHSWVEAWIPGQGWTTFDPTPPDYGAPAYTLISKLTLYMDAAQTFWQDWVVGYDMNRQGTLAFRMEQEARGAGIRWFDIAARIRENWDRRLVPAVQGGLPWVLLVVALAIFVRLAGPRIVRLLRMRSRVQRARRGEVSVGDATLLYESMLRALRRRGYQKPPWFTPAEFAASLPSSPMGAAVTEFTCAYNALRFGGRTEVAPRMSALLDELERQGRVS